MKRFNLKSSFALVLLLALVLPILAACGGEQGGAPAAQATTAPAAGGTEATAAPAEGGAEATPAEGEAPTVPETGGTTGGAGNAEAGVLRLNTGSEPENVDPQKASFVSEIQFIMMNYEGLTTFDQNGEAIPAQAESWEVSEDGTTYTFKLRPDLKYSDGSPLTAQNFVYAWQRLADPETAGEYQSLPCGIVKGYSEYSAAACQGKTLTETLELGNLEELKANLGVSAPDDSTVQFVLENPAPYFPSMAALWLGVPVREEDASQGEDWWYDPANYIGNGPFMLTEWEHDSRAVWEPNPNYAGPLGPVKLQQVVYNMINEGQVAFQAYQNGELDVLTASPEDLASIQSDPTLSKELIDIPGQCTFYIGFNTQKAPFDNVQVRQAFAQAVDREAWVNDVFQGLGKPAQSFIPPGFPGYMESDMWAFDPEAAKQALADAGYPNGEGLPEIKLTFSSSARNKTRFEFLANQFRQNLGINPVLDPVDPTAYSGIIKENPPQMFYLGWCADYPDPQNWLSQMRTGGVINDRIGWTNEEFNQLTQQADVEQDEAKRAELYDQAHKILIEDAPVVFMNFQANKALVKPYVQGITTESVTPLDYWPGFFNLPNVDVQP